MPDADHNDHYGDNRITLPWHGHWHEHRMVVVMAMGMGTMIIMVMRMLPVTMLMQPLYICIHAEYGNPQKHHYNNDTTMQALYVV